MIVLERKPDKRRVTRSQAVSEGWYVPNDSGLCECGCGERTPLARQTNRGIGWLSGEPKRFIHGHNARTVNVTHGYSKTPLYAVWKTMRARCSNPNNKSWENYGGRGIKVCDRWQSSYENFLADVGERPPGLTLDRIDPDGDYEPGNVRWATWHVQRINRRRR